VMQDETVGWVKSVETRYGELLGPSWSART
jgi:hypothetical protein